jgi:uncharacterized membrane protein
MKFPGRLNKKKLIITVVAVVVAIGVIAGGVYWLMQSTESGATKSIEKNQTAVANALKTLNAELVNKEITPKGRLDTFDQFNQTLRTIESDLCKSPKGSPVYALTKAKEHCEISHQKLSDVKKASQNIENSIKDDQAFALIIAPASKNDATDPAKQLEIWTTVVSKLQALNVSDSSTELKKNLVATSTAYKTTWQDLITADNAKNKADYEGAIKRLQAVHGTVVKASEQQALGLKSLLAKFKEATVAFTHGK